MQYHDLNEHLIIGDETDYIQSNQRLGEDFWKDLENQKEAFQFRLDGLTPVATIPEGLANKWLREGFDFWNAPAKEIIRKLRADEYSNFVIPQSQNPF